MWEKPEHLFACFYQLRRAFLCLFQEIVGSSQPVRQLRVRVWESVFTQDMLSYQQWMHESVGKFPTLVTGPTGSGRRSLPEPLDFRVLFLMTRNLENCIPAQGKAFDRLTCLP